MATIQAFRNSATPSPFRYSYGMRAGMLLFPLDLAFTHYNPDVCDTGASFIGSAIDGAGFSVGTIAAYTFPAVGPVNPIVYVTPSAGFPAASVSVLPVVPAPIAPAGASISVDLGTSTVSGSILSYLAAAPYLDAAHTIQAYVATLAVPLTPDYNGAPVSLSATGAIIGMLITAQQPNGSQLTLVAVV